MVVSLSHDYKRGRNGTVKMEAKVDSPMPVLPKVCVTLQGQSVDDYIREAGRAAVAGADSVEIRFDQLWTRVVEEQGQEDESEVKYVTEIITLDEVDVKTSMKSLVEGIERPIILSCSSPAIPKGVFPGTNSDRYEVLKIAVESGVDMINIDTEFSDDDVEKLISIAKDKNIEIIRSDIKDEEAPPVEEIVERLKQLGSEGALVRYVRQCEESIHGLRLIEAGWKLKNEENPPYRSIGGIGRSGDWPRIHAPLHGDSVVFAVMDEGAKIQSSGEVNARDIRVAWEVLEYP